MNESKVLVVAPKDDLHAGAVAKFLLNRGRKVAHVDLASLGSGYCLSLLPGPEASPEAFLKTASGEVVRTSQVSSVWWRRPRVPVAAATLDEEVRTFVRSEWEHFLGGLNAFGGKLWVNSPAADKAASYKAPQLLLAQSVGLRVPRTVVTNDP